MADLNVTVRLLSEVVSPLTHMAGTAGNESLVARSPVITPRGVRRVPWLSGNGLRHRLVREPGALWLIRTLRLIGRLTWQQANFLLCGGSLTDSTGREDTRRIAEMQELFPLLRLLGGSLPDQILAGSLRAWPGRLVCEETRPYLVADLPGSIPDAVLRPAESFVAPYQYTRGDARKQYPRMATDPVDADPASSNLMIFAGEQVIAGALFAHGFTLAACSPLEVGCLLHALGEWRAAGGTVGGGAGRGHGRLTTSLVDDGGLDVDGLVAGYVAHVEAHADRCRAWLEAAFARREPRAKGRKGKTAAAATVEEVASD